MGQGVNPEYESLLEEAEIDVMTVDGFDDCILGVLERFGSQPFIVYDRAALLAKLTEQMEGCENSAIEWYDFNVLGAWLGEGTPGFLVSKSMDNEKKLLTREQVSEILNISVPTLDREVRRKKLACVKIGRRTLFSRDQIEAYIEKCTVDVK